MGAQRLGNHRHDFCSRRINTKLRAAREWFRKKGVGFLRYRAAKEKSKRSRGCAGRLLKTPVPYASRVPFEVWILHRRTINLFDSQGGSNGILQRLRVLPGLEKVSLALSLVCTLVQHAQQKRRTGGYWKTLADDFTAIEIFHRGDQEQVLASKETYFNAVLPSRRGSRSRSNSCVKWRRTRSFPP